MVVAPLPHPLDIGGAAEVMAVIGFVQPPPLAGRFAGLSAWRLGTVVLPPHVAGVRIKECLTVLALTLSHVTYHGPASPQAHDRHIAAWKEENGEANPGEKGERRAKKLRAMAFAGRKRRGVNLHVHSTRLTAISGHR
jgi:hypothetical protein